MILEQSYNGLVSIVFVNFFEMIISLSDILFPCVGINLWEYIGQILARVCYLREPEIYVFFY